MSSSWALGNGLLLLVFYNSSVLPRWLQKHKLQRKYQAMSQWELWFGNWGFWILYQQGIWPWPQIGNRETKLNLYHRTSVEVPIFLPNWKHPYFYFCRNDVCSFGRKVLHTVKNEILSPFPMSSLPRHKPLLKFWYKSSQTLPKKVTTSFIHLKQNCATYFLFCNLMF